MNRAVGCVRGRVELLPLPWQDRLSTRMRVVATARQRRGDDAIYGDDGSGDPYAFVSRLMRLEQPPHVPEAKEQEYAWVPYRGALYLPLWLAGGHNEWWRLSRVSASGVTAAPITDAAAATAAVEGPGSVSTSGGGEVVVVRMGLGQLTPRVEAEPAEEDAGPGQAVEHNGLDGQSKDEAAKMVHGPRPAGAGAEPTGALLSSEPAAAPPKRKPLFMIGSAIPARSRLPPPPLPPEAAAAFPPEPPEPAPSDQLPPSPSQQEQGTPQQQRQQPPGVRATEEELGEKQLRMKAMGELGLAGGSPEPAIATWGLSAAGQGAALGSLALSQPVQRKPLFMLGSDIPARPRPPSLSPGAAVLLPPQSSEPAAFSSASLSQPHQALGWQLGAQQGQGQDQRQSQQAEQQFGGVHGGMGRNGPGEDQQRMQGNGVQGLGSERVEAATVTWGFAAAGEATGVAAAAESPAVPQPVQRKPLFMLGSAIPARPRAPPPLQPASQALANMAGDGRPLLQQRGTSVAQPHAGAADAGGAGGDGGGVKVVQEGAPGQAAAALGAEESRPRGSIGWGGTDAGDRRSSSALVASGGGVGSGPGPSAPNFAMAWQAYQALAHERARQHAQLAAVGPPPPQPPPPSNAPTQPLPGAMAQRPQQQMPPTQDDTELVQPRAGRADVDGTQMSPLVPSVPASRRVRPTFTAPQPARSGRQQENNRQPLAPVIPTHAADKARAVAVMARRLALAEPQPPPAVALGTAAAAPGGLLQLQHAPDVPGGWAATSAVRLASTAAPVEQVARVSSPLGWELSVSCYGAGTPRAERLISWIPVCTLPGEGTMGAAVLTAEQLLLSLVTEAEPYWYGGAPASSARPTSRSSGASSASSTSGDAEMLPTELAAAVAAAARNASGVPITAPSFHAGLQRTSLSRVGAREPSSAQQGLLMRLMRQGHLRSLDPEVFYALCPEALQARLAAEALNGSGGQQGTAAAGVSAQLHAAADAPQLGLLLHHLLAVQQLEEAAENAMEAGSAAAAAALGLPPPITRRQRGRVQSLLRQAARGVEADSGAWLRGIFRGGVPERKLQRLVSELVGDEYYGSTSDSYDMEMHYRRQAGQQSRGPPVPPMDALLGMLSRDGAAEVIKRLKRQVDKLPPREE